MLGSLTNAAGITGEIEELVVVASQSGKELLGEAEAASVGTVINDQIRFRPMLRPAELLETIPGMVVTQHSGDGKANQYFLRGFNLDHGTDFANHVEGMPVNNVTHGHGQGYTDLNFLIPELVDRMVYKKGPYYASEGDFSSAGSAHIAYANSLEKTSLKMTVGENNNRRMLAYGGIESGESDHWTYGVELMRNDGPWQVAEDFDKQNAVLKYSRDEGEYGFSLAAFYYDASWTSTDQIPQRLVKSGELDRYGSLDSTTGGDSQRYSLNGSFWGKTNSDIRYNGSLYVVDYQLRLTTNATYFSKDETDDPDLRGDQFTQFDERVFSGGEFDIERDLTTLHHLEGGVSYRYDDIGNVGVGSSQNADIYDILSRSSVTELSMSGFLSLHSQWNDWFATIVGGRYDFFKVDVNSKLAGGVEGNKDDDLVSPKLSMRFGPFSETEIFVNYGEGFHSNDARGVVDSRSNVPMLSESKGYEMGMRSAIVDGLEFSVVLFRLDLDSELVFVGDDATTEPRGETTRSGVEVGLFYRPVDWLILDVDFAESDTIFREQQFDEIGTALGDNVPDSLDRVFSLGASVDLDNGVFAGVRMRYFGPRNLSETGEVKSKSTEIVNANVGYRLQNGWSIGLEIINLFDSKDDDITYLFESRTLAEREKNIDPIEDFHSHPMEPRTVRASIAYEF